MTSRNRFFKPKFNCEDELELARIEEAPDMNDGEATHFFVKAVCVLGWMFVASYYFTWGENERTVNEPVDESGWVPDGAYARRLGSNIL